MDPRSAARCEAGGQRRILPPRIFPRQLAPPPGRGAGPRGRRGRRPPRRVTATGHHPTSPAVPGRNLAVDRPSPQPGSTGSSRRSGLPGPWSAPDPARSAPDHAQGCARSPRPGSTGPSPARQLLSVRSTGQLAPQAPQAGGLRYATGGPGRAYPIGGPESRLPHLAPGAAPARNDQPRSRLPLGGSWGLRLPPPVSPPVDHSPRPGSTGSFPRPVTCPCPIDWSTGSSDPEATGTPPQGPSPTPAPSPDQGIAPRQLAPGLPQRE